MSEQNKQQNICPFLGLAEDPDSHFVHPNRAHRCFATRQPSDISAEHQSSFCLSQNYSGCSRFVGAPADADSIATLRSAGAKANSADKAGAFSGRVVLWGVTGLVVALIAVFGVIYYSNLAFQQEPAPEGVVSKVIPSPTPRQTAIAIPTDTAATETPTPMSAAFLATPTPTNTPESDNTIYTLSPNSADIGWVSSGEERGNHFGDSFLYAGIFEGQVYHGAFQFDLSSIPRGAPIYHAEIQMTGLQEDRLGIRSDRPAASGPWMLRLLEPEIDQEWRRHSYQEIFNAPVLQTLNPFLEDQDLAESRTNLFELTSDQIRILEARIIDDEEPRVSFRLDGPLTGPDNLFAWDTGYGPKSQGNKVSLILEVGSPPATPPPYDYVVITSTPTPENVVTVAAIVMQMTADAAQFGTATPVPANFATATPIPDYLVIVPSPTPENAATAQYLDVVATAEAIVTGTATPFPTNAVTATATPSATPEPPPVSISYVLITATPTAESIFVAATMAAAATAQTMAIGTPTPLPAEWVTPIVVTPTPTPINEATAQALADLATAIAFTTGTPTATPFNMVTATPTPVFEAIPLILTPTLVAPTPIPQPLPPRLLGTILFLSDREGGETPGVYMFDPETGELGRLTERWPYDVALARDAWSADERFRVFTKDAIRYARVGSGGNTEDVRNDAPALYVYDYLYEVETQITDFGTGIAYGGVWSPTDQRIAFVSNDSGDDEIWVVNYDDNELRRLTVTNEAYNGQEIGKDSFIPELSKYPTWSPDGKQIVFTSNRTGNQQLWLMSADGSDQRLLMGWDNWTPYNDWAPVWVKYLDPAPFEVEEGKDES